MNVYLKNALLLCVIVIVVYPITYLNLIVQKLQLKDSDSFQVGALLTVLILITGSVIYAYFVLRVVESIYLIHS